MGAFALAGGSILSSLLGGILGGRAANEQAAAALQGSNSANQTIYNNSLLTRSDLAPYTQAGTGSATLLSNLLGVGPKPGTATATPQNSAEISQKQSTLKFLQDWMNGLNPVGADGQHIGDAPRNAVTRAKVQGQIEQLQRDINNLQTIDQNSAAQAQAVNQQDPNSYGSLLKDFTTSDFQTDPGYQFRLSEGQKALERSQAAKGGLFSGQSLKALDQYNQNFASNEFQNAYNRFNQNRQTKYNMLTGTMGIGQNSSAQQANLGQQSTLNIANNTINAMNDAAAAKASGYATTANAINGGMNSLLQLYLSRRQAVPDMNTNAVYNLPVGSYRTPPFIDPSQGIRV